MSHFEALEGNAAVATAMRQINPDVVAAYPITPSTALPQTFAQFVADGLVDSEFIPVESEHSAMSACIGAAAAGGRVMTATSANGLALMWEMLYIASGARAPIVMTVVNRALSGPINIHCDHSDSMGARDAGWIQLYSENGQEAYENVIQAVRIAEHMDVRLPVMVCMDGFITSHALERVAIYEDEAVREFIGEYRPYYPLLDVDNPVTYGPFDFYDNYFEHKRQQVEAMRRAKPVILDVGKAFNATFGREYGLFDTYRLDDAEVALVMLNSTAGTARAAIDKMRGDGVKIGLLKPRVFRPFPGDEFVDALKHVKAIGVLDRAVSFGGLDNGGPLWYELCAALFTRGQSVPTANYIYGLGGRDFTPHDVEAVAWDVVHVAETGKVSEMVKYVGVRGEGFNLAPAPNGRRQ
jgi:pyruvate ferredoxin oxidoreductase alpha subunit